MKKSIAKKTIILYVLKMLDEGSSLEKPITQTNMAKVLHSIGISCDRKTIGRNIKYLQDFGYPIMRVGTNGYYMNKENSIEEGKNAQR